MSAFPDQEPHKSRQDYKTLAGPNGTTSYALRILEYHFYQHWYHMFSGWSQQLGSPI